MVEGQALRDVVQELLRMELEQFGLQMKDILCQVIREEFLSWGSESSHRRKRPSRYSTSMGSKSPRSLRRQSINSIVSQMSMLQDASIKDADAEPPTCPPESRTPVLMIMHKDSTRQLELVPQKLDSSHHSLLDDSENERFLEKEAKRSSRVNSGNSHSRRRAALEAFQRMRSENNARQSVADPLWANRHRRGHEFQETRSDPLDGEFRDTWMKAFVNGLLWARVTGIMVVLNAIEIGCQVNYEAVTWTEELPAIFPFLDKVFCIFFVLELLLRASVLGLAEFFCNSGQWRYNIFDLVLVTLQVSETMQAFPAISHLSILRMLRLMRILRLARILHLIVTDFKVLHEVGFENSDSEDFHHILELYGSVDRSMLSLYAMVSEGVHWRELSDPLSEHISPWISVLFFFFSAFAFLAVMNVVTGVFVESALHSAAEDKKMRIAFQLCDLFKHPDEDGSGTISWDEFQAQLSSTQMQTCLKEVDVDPEDAEELFRLLDIDHSGSIDVEELVNGTIRFMGYAKAIDLATFVHEYRLNNMRWASHARCVEECLVTLLSDWADSLDD